MPIQHFTLFLPDSNLSDPNNHLSDFPLDHKIIQAKIQAARAATNYYSGLRNLWSYYAETDPPDDINAAQVNQVLVEQADKIEHAEALALMASDATIRLEAEDKVNDLTQNQTNLAKAQRTDYD